MSLENFIFISNVGWEIKLTYSNTTCLHLDSHRYRYRLDIDIVYSATSGIHLIKLEWYWPSRSSKSSAPKAWNPIQWSFPNGRDLVWNHTHTHQKKTKSSHKSETLTSSCPIPWEKIPKSYFGIVIKLFTVFKLTTVYPCEICFNFCGGSTKKKPKKLSPTSPNIPKLAFFLVSCSGNFLCNSSNIFSEGSMPR